MQSSTVEIERGPDRLVLPKGLSRLDKLQTLNGKPTWINRDIYRLLYMPELYVAAYERIKSNPGNMTHGLDRSTLDGLNLEWVNQTVDLMRTEKFNFTAGRRVLIPKASGGERPLTVGSPRDKVVQEVMRTILECIYDSPHGPSFLDCSHGFRRGRGTHTALKAIRSWQNVNWFVDADIKGCFDNVDHHVLIEVLRKRIEDERFINLTWKAIRAGYVWLKESRPSLSGTPQGSIISPILANIYLHEFDLFMEELRGRYERGGSRRRNPVYRRLQQRIERARDKDASVTELREMYAELRRTPSADPEDPNFIRINYIRYADDWLVGVVGPKSLAEQIRQEAGEFLSSRLKLTLSPEKTHIRHASSDPTLFLGTSLMTLRGQGKVAHIQRGDQKFRKRVSGWFLSMGAPTDRIVKRLSQAGFCTKGGSPTHKKGWINHSDVQIIEMYNSVLLGTLNYYSFVDNRARLGWVQTILQHSAAMTLASKHRLKTRRAVFRKFGPTLRVQEQRADGEVVTRSLALQTLTRNPMRFLSGDGPKGDLTTPLLNRYTRSHLGSPCCVCGETTGVEMHHLRHIRKSNQKLTGFNKLMGQLNRKQIPVCRNCHENIHGGRYDGISLKELLYAPR